MKFSKKLTKFFAATAMSAMLLSTAVNATTVRIPNMGGVSTQYAAMVQAANTFDDTLGTLIADAFTKACYTTDALNNAIANTNNAINAINNINFIDKNNVNVGTSGGLQSNTLVRDNGFIAQAKNYLASAQLTGGILFGFSPATNSGLSVAAGTERPTSEYFDTLNFVVSTSLYATGRTTSVVSYDSNSKTVSLNGVSNIVTTLNRYVAFLSTVRAFDQAAGCYDSGNVTTTPDTTNNTNKTKNPDKTNKTSKDEKGNVSIDASDVTINVGDTFDIMSGVTATNANGKDITNQITTSGEVNTAKAGKYDVTYSVSGISKEITVTVVAKTSDAVINASNLTINVGDKFDPLTDVKANDDAGKGSDISNLLTVTGSVDTSKVGDYKLTYCVIGENGNKVAREITVTVQKAKASALINAQDSTIKVGESFDKMAGVTAADKDGKGKDLSSKVTVTGDVNNKKVGTYTLTYSVTGANGVEVTKTVTVNVVKDIKDAIIEAYDRTVSVGGDFDKMRDVKALDNNGSGKDITKKVTVDGYVDTNTPGDYEVTYTVAGNNEKEVSKTVTITVLGTADNNSTDSNVTDDTTNGNTTGDNTTSDNTISGNTTCALVDTTCAPVNTTCAPVNTTCAPVNTTCAPVNTTCAPVNTTCAPILPTCVGINLCALPVVVPVQNDCTQVPNCTQVPDCTQAPVCTQVPNCTQVPVCEPNTTCVPVDTTCVPVDTTCVPVDTTCEPVVPVDTTCEVVVPVDTTCAPVEPEACDPIRIVVDPIKVEILNKTIQTEDTNVVLADTTFELPTQVIVTTDDTMMKPTGTNLIELVFSGLSLLGTAFVAKKRK